MANLQERIAIFNKDKTDPEKYFVKGSIEQQQLLEGKVIFPIQWMYVPNNCKGLGIADKEVSLKKFFRRALKRDTELSKELYFRNIIDITTDTLFDCCDTLSDTSMEIGNHILNVHQGVDIPLGYWKRDMNICLNRLMLYPFSDHIKIISLKLLQRGASFNSYYGTNNIIELLLKQYPKLLTVDKFEFMLQNGLNINNLSTGNFPLNPTGNTLLSTMTNNIDLDTYIQLLMLIKKYNPNL